MNNILHINKNCQIVIYSKRKDLKILEGKNIKIFNSLEKCLSEKPDIGFITNETAFHVPTAKKLAELGLDLFIEKPLSNSMKNVKDLTKIVKEKKIITLMGCNLRFDRCIKKIKSLINQKTIGKIISIKVECGTYLPDWHPYENYSESYAGRDDLGGGVVLTCIHEIDYLYWFFGEIKEVFSITGKFSDLEISSDDLSAMLIRFKNKVIGEIHLDYFPRSRIRSCKVIGTKGIIYWDSEIESVRLYNNRTKKWTQVIKLKNFDNNSMYIDELSYFLKCVSVKKQTMNPINQGARTLDVALAGHKLRITLGQK